MRYLIGSFPISKSICPCTATVGRTAFGPITGRNRRARAHGPRGVAPRARPMDARSAAATVLAPAVHVHAHHAQPPPAHFCISKWRSTDTWACSASTMKLWCASQAAQRASLATDAALVWKDAKGFAPSRVPPTTFCATRWPTARPVLAVCHSPRRRPDAQFWIAEDAIQALLQSARTNVKRHSRIDLAPRRACLHVAQGASNSNHAGEHERLLSASTVSRVGRAPLSSLSHLAPCQATARATPSSPPMITCHRCAKKVEDCGGLGVWVGAEAPRSELLLSQQNAELWPAPFVPTLPRTSNGA